MQMLYGEVITRAFSLMWRHKYLWLLAILGGADVGTGGFGGNFSGLNNVGRGSNGLNGGAAIGGGQVPDVGRFLQDNAGLIAIGVALLLVLALAWFLLSCVTTGALVRASAEHDAERPFRLGLAWQAGVETFWSILGLRLLGLLYGLVVVGVIGLLVLLGVVSAVNNQSGALALVIAVGILVLFVVIVVSIALGLAFILATRAVVLERRGAVAALGRGFGLLRTRLGRVLLVWLIQIGLGLAAGIGIAIALIPVVLLGVGVAIIAATTRDPAPAIVIGIPVGLLFLALLVVIGGMVGAYLSTYWTLAFRRLELEAPRPVAWPPAAFPPPAAG
ncbi:MAG TPA: hypothetical protein VGO86_18250 [Candidatus Dormibacteraeota bacterium]